MSLLARLALAGVIGAPLSTGATAIGFQEALHRESGTFQVPGQVILLHRPLEMAASAHDLNIDAAGVKLQLAPDFQGRAAIVISGSRNIRLSGVSIDGGRDRLSHAVQDLPPSDVPFAKFTRDSGILAEKTNGLRLERLSFTHIAGFAILVSASEKVVVKGATVRESGSLNARHRNNATGGILMEEGTRDFEISGCDLREIRGNGIWTHSLYHSTRSSEGRIFANNIATIGRDAIQVGHASRVAVEKNSGAQIGFPVEIVDKEGGATPVAIDTAGNVDLTQYRDNDFAEVNGKCIDLDGFHDGEVRNNACINQQERDAYPNANYGIAMNNSNPDMKSKNILIWGNRLEGFLYSGILVIGSGHRIAHNHMVKLNLAHCNEGGARYYCLYLPKEPDFLRSGIYLRAGNHRPEVTRDNIIEDNEVNGYGMGARCVVAGPGVDLAQNRVGHNDCTDDQPVTAGKRSYELEMTREMAFTSLRMGGSSKRENTSSSPSLQVE